MRIVIMPQSFSSSRFCGWESKPRQHIGDRAGSFACASYQRASTRYDDALRLSPKVLGLGHEIRLAMIVTVGAINMFDGVSVEEGFEQVSSSIEPIPAQSLEMDLEETMDVTAGSAKRTKGRRSLIVVG